MTQTKFTPGPWDTKGTHRRHTDFGVFANNGRGICSTGGFSDGKEDTYSQNKANAHLIAAAPELYEALEQLVAIIEKAGIHNLMNGVQLGPVVWAVKAEDAKAYANEILAKARGES